MSEYKEMRPRTKDLLDLNDLLYVDSTETTLSINRSQRRQYSQRNTYASNTADTIVYELHGDNFCDFTESWLGVDLTITPGSATNITFGQYGTILNTFKEVRVYAPNGKELARTQRHNLLMYHLNKQKLGFWAQSTLLASLGNGIASLGGTLHPFRIPLRMVSPFFDTAQLCPPQILDNMRIEIELEKPSMAFISANPNIPTSYTLSNPSILLDCILLSDDAKTIVMRQSPLYYEFKSYDHSESSYSTDVNRFDLPFPNPVANALEAIVLSRNVASFATTLADKFKTILPAAGDYYYFRWGQLQMPQQQITGLQELYAQLLYVNKKLCKNNLDSFSVTYADFTTEVSGVGTGTMAATVCDLRRSPVEDKSGLEISNKNNLMVTYEAASAVNRLVDFYVEYVGRVQIVNGVIDVLK